MNRKNFIKTAALFAAGTVFMPSSIAVDDPIKWGTEGSDGKIILKPQDRKTLDAIKNDLADFGEFIELNPSMDLDKLQDDLNLKVMLHHVNDENVEKGYIPLPEWNKEKTCLTGNVYIKFSDKCYNDSFFVCEFTIIRIDQETV